LFDPRLDKFLLPQVAENNTPRAMDVTGEVLLYDDPVALE